MSVALHLATNVRALREARGLTQAQVARAAGVPRPTWANLESGQANPTLAVLLRVAGALQVSVEELISPPRAVARLFRAESLPSRKRGRAVVRKVLPDPMSGLDIERIELPVGATMTGIPHTPGTREYLTCESGALELTASGETFQLAPGDVVVFRGDQHHSYANPGERPAVGYSVIVLSPA